MKRILISGGPVHAYLDAVKIITNKFKGGLMAKLASELVIQNPLAVSKVIYLTNKGSRLPQPPTLTMEGGKIEVVYHDGFEDYRDKVQMYADEVDAVILGAAVANLIPMSPLKGKFPSHDYKVGDRIPIDFTIAPRIINEVKPGRPNVNLFGFKLLSGVEHSELIRAAYEIVLDSGATAVFANDATNLEVVYAVTKERAVHTMHRDRIGGFIFESINDEYYHTQPGKLGTFEIEMLRTFSAVKDHFASEFNPIPEGYVFGTIAIRHPKGGFLTTGRGKHELDDKVLVREVDHEKRLIITGSGDKKASLNAPLLDWIFKHNPDVEIVVHYHKQMEGLHTLPYAPPGTVRDSQRACPESFNIDNHGCFLFFNKYMKFL